MGRDGPVEDRADPGDRKVAIEQSLDRVKICPADDCRWAFYDTSRNRSRQWYSMEGCGNRAKASAHRQRHAQP